MTNRREILQAAAAAALPLAARASESGETAAPRSIDLHAVLVDARHAAARAFGARFASRGTTVYAVPEGDITQIWLRHIDPVWRIPAGIAGKPQASATEPVAIAGLTERPALFCLEQLALASGMRVVFHGEHIIHGGQTQHQLLRGSQAANLSLRDLQRAGPRWPIRVADAIAVHRRYPIAARFGRSDAALEPILPPGAQLLSSWIIAAA